MPGRVLRGSPLPLSLLVLGAGSFWPSGSCGFGGGPSKGEEVVTSPVPRQEGQCLAGTQPQPPALVGQIWGQTRLLRALPSQVLETSEAGGSTAFLGILYQC